MKKLTSCGLLLLTVLSLQACSQNQSDGQETDSKGGTVTQEVKNENKYIGVELLGGEYIIPRDSDKTYLAVELKVKNLGADSISVSSYDFNLYDSDGDSTKAEYVYLGDDDLKTLDSNKISKEKSTSGYLFFDVDKEESYTLEYSTDFTVSGDYKELAPLSLDIDPKSFTDRTGELDELATEFVQTVFLAPQGVEGQETVSHKKEGEVEVSLLTDKKDDKSEEKVEQKAAEAKFDTDFISAREDFLKGFSSSMEKLFGYYKPTDKEIQSLVAAYIDANSKQAKIEYKVKSYTPNLLEIYVRPETLDFNSLNTQQLTEEFLSKNQETNFTNSDDMSTAFERYALEQLPTRFKDFSLKFPQYMDKDGYLLRLKNSDGKWVLDTSESSYQYDSLVSAFMGNLDKTYFMF